MTTRKPQAAASGIAGTACSSIILAYPIRRFSASVPNESAARIAFAMRAIAITMVWLLIAIANDARKATTWASRNFAKLAAVVFEAPLTSISL